MELFVLFPGIARTLSGVTGLDNPAFQKSVEDDVSINYEIEDIWALPELKVDFKPWNKLTGAEKLKRLFLHYILKIVLLLCALYIFICSLSFLGDAFKLLGGKAAGQAFSENEILSNPVAGLMIGVLATVLLQSSSTTTSIVVSMVGSGELLTVKQAIPIVMGANIGTSVTNTIVSLGQITNKDDFRRAFAGATVHDAFNWLTVLVFLPIEIITGYLERLSGAIIDSIPEFSEDMKDLKRDYLKVITNPFTKLIIQIDKNVITKIAKGDVEYLDKSIIKHVCCDKLDNGTKVNCHTCKFLFEGISQPGKWSDAAIGAILLVIALALLCVCLVLIVKLLHSLLRGQIAHIIRKFVNANFPGKCGYFTGYLAILIGAGLTILVQSSSIFTSSITPLVGMGVLSLDRMYPLTLGSNIGTTATGILAAFAQDPDKIPNSLQIALCHLFFNISGIVIFYPLPFFRPPINMAKFLGVQTAKYRWFAIVYLIIAFLLLPAAGFGLSVASWIALAAVFIPIAVLILIIMLIKLIQNKRPQCLPPVMRNWKWLPEPLRSLAPFDRFLMSITGNCYCCRKVGCLKAITDDSDERTHRRTNKEFSGVNSDSNTKLGDDFHAVSYDDSYEKSSSETKFGTQVIGDSMKNDSGPSVISYDNEIISTKM
ncbi:sodium-dependent phosphate transport protein 2B-like [Mercenaria mercenaria]|uniref:sodium-dependent phosphate transport protein 2B-like n=1 Tax=Mercenaria mercenaria TaxID=6596 RepID=UPI001E1D34FC|nr:sodium-dependent phosphate transport protein 2B-like [Mercenaria mercenaria]